jgi:hypothetical protein
VWWEVDFCGTIMVLLPLKLLLLLLLLLKLLLLLLFPTTTTTNNNNNNGIVGRNLNKTENIGNYGYTINIRPRKLCRWLLLLLLVVVLVVVVLLVLPHICVLKVPGQAWF